MRLLHPSITYIIVNHRLHVCLVVMGVLVLLMVMVPAWLRRVEV